MTRYDGLGFGRKEREFSSREEALEWLSRRKHKKFRGKQYYSIRKTR